jgi:hypothetical protein
VARTGIAGTVFIAAAAFWLSFTSLSHLAQASGIAGAQAWAWPLIVDGIIVVATVAVVAMAGRPGVWYPWTLLAGGAVVSVTANSIHATITPHLGVPRLMAAAVAAVPPVVLLAITHLTVLLTRHTRSPAIPDRTPTLGQPRPEPAPPALTHPTPAPPALAHPAPGAPAGNTGDPILMAPSSAAASCSPTPVVAPAPPSAPTPAGRVVPAGVTTAVRAGTPRGMGGWKQAKAVDMHRRGAGSRVIAAELGVGKSTVNRWLQPHRGTPPTTDTIIGGSDA